MRDIKAVQVCASYNKKNKLFLVIVNKLLLFLYFWYWVSIRIWPPVWYCSKITSGNSEHDKKTVETINIPWSRNGHFAAMAYRAQNAGYIDLTQ